MRTLTILAAGDVEHAAYAPLAARFDSVQQIALGIDPSAALEDHKAEVNRAIDASPGGWILILRAGEAIDDSLATEMSDAASDTPAAWGYRLRTVALYGGRPLRTGAERDGEIRLVHRRHCRFDLRSDAREMKVEGPVMRLREPVRLVVYASAAEHRARLQQTAVPHSTLRRILVFSKNTILTGAWKARWATLHFLWIEAGYDRAQQSPTRPIHPSR